MASSILLRSLAFAAVALMIAPGTASAVSVHAQVRDGIMDDVLDRGLDPERWVPVLDGHVHFDGEERRLFIEYSITAGDSQLRPPVEYEAASRCVQMGGTTIIYVYLRDCVPESSIQT